ncbi:hypothetical protein BLNAU_4074 [Blattamonas nauphoetae]|uniref:Uncharacterized protein n=1 Tax=Blattamonas nauphoetae TaxID=2049346 RepID=A0ABQ9YB36_9EUKA|nr:hypothetical protein BLNAU_4074 [Blattamonas nauphoetae]
MPPKTHKKRSKTPSASANEAPVSGQPSTDHQNPISELKHEDPVDTTNDNSSDTSITPPDNSALSRSTQLLEDVKTRLQQNLSSESRNQIKEKQATLKELMRTQSEHLKMIDAISADANTPPNSITSKLFMNDGNSPERMTETLRNGGILKNKSSKMPFFTILRRIAQITSVVLICGYVVVLLLDSDGQVVRNIFIEKPEEFARPT